MQEHNEIDELFKDGLEHFKPDASHLSYGPLASAIAGKTTVAGTAAVAKTGFFANWGMTVYLGLSAAVAGTGVAIVYAPEQVAVEANHKTILVASAQVKEELQLLLELPVSDSVLVKEEGFFPKEEAALSGESIQTEQTKSTLSTDKTTWERGVYRSRKATIIPEKQTKQETLSAYEVEPIVAAETAIQQNLTGESIDRKAHLGQQDVVVKSMTGLPLNTKAPAQPEKLRPLPAAVDSLIASAETLLAGGDKIPSTATDSVSNTTSRVIRHTPAVWPQSKFSIKAGLGYVPLKTEFVENENDGITDTVPLAAMYYFGDKVILTPSINNEFTLNLGYQKRMKNNMQLGVGVGYMRGGWDAYVDYSQEYWVENGVGSLVYVSDTFRIGEYNFDYRSFTLNLYSGYDFVFDEKWMISATCGVGLNQVFTTKDYRSYSSNKITQLNRSDFLLSGFGAADLTYRVNNIGFSVGAAINGRTNLGKTIDAQDFHNNVSFGLNAGFHYFIADRIR